MKRAVVKVALLGALTVAGLAGFATPAAAQGDDTRTSVSVGAAFLRWVSFEGFTTKGVAGDVVKPLMRMPDFRIVGDVGVYSSGGEMDSTFLAGLRYARQRARMAFFGQLLFGGVHWNDGEDSDIGFAVVPGFGVIFMVRDNIGIKGQVDYFLMKWINFPNEGNLLRYWFGVEFKFGKK